MLFHRLSRLWHALSVRPVGPRPDFGSPVPFEVRPQPLLKLRPPHFLVLMTASRSSSVISCSPSSGSSQAWMLLRMIIRLFPYLSPQRTARCCLYLARVFCCLLFVVWLAMGASPQGFSRKNSREFCFTRTLRLPLQNNTCRGSALPHCPGMAKRSLQALF